MPRLTFATYASSRPQAGQAALLAASLRSFGGSLAASPIRVLAPEGAEWVTREAGADLDCLGADVVPLPPGPFPLDVPFADKAAAAAAAEARQGTGLLAWLDPDTVILQEPAPFLLPEAVVLGYRPVHHRLIGIEWGRPADGFWQRLWRTFGVPGTRLLPMTSSVGEALYPYLNAGSLVVRAERGLLQAWSRGLAAALAEPALAALCRGSDLHAVFLHQAVLTAVALAALRPEEMVDLGPGVNYPLHLHHEVPAHLRPSRVDDLITARTEDVLADPVRRGRLPLTPALRRWLESRLPLVAS